MNVRASVLRSVLAAVALSLCSGAAQAAPKIETDEQKMFYALGTLVGRSLEEFRVTEEEFESVVVGLRDAVLGKELLVSADDFRTQLQALQKDRAAVVLNAEKEASGAYVKQAAAAKGAKTTDSGLVMTKLTAGKGASPKATDTVRVHYHGTLRDGTVFDSSVERKQPAEFPLNRVIPCWTEGVQKMKVGGKSRLVCPSDIAYGDAGRPGSIPGGAALTFEVELLTIVSASE